MVSFCRGSLLILRLHSSGTDPKPHQSHCQQKQQQAPIPGRTFFLAAAGCWLRPAALCIRFGSSAPFWGRTAAFLPAFIACAALAGRRCLLPGKILLRFPGILGQLRLGKSGIQVRFCQTVYRIGIDAGRFLGILRAASVGACPSRSRGRAASCSGSSSTRIQRVVSSCCQLVFPDRSGRRS